MHQLQVICFLIGATLVSGWLYARWPLLTAFIAALVVAWFLYVGVRIA